MDPMEEQEETGVFDPETGPAGIVRLAPILAAVGRITVGMQICVVFAVIIPGPDRVGAVPVQAVVPEVELKFRLSEI
jgi:hypothetical protein